MARVPAPHHQRLPRMDFTRPISHSHSHSQSLHPIQAPSPPRGVIYPVDQDHYQRKASQTALHDSQQHNVAHMPHEPTPPDSGRSKSIREYDMSLLDEHGNFCHDGADAVRYHSHPAYAAHRGTQESVMDTADESDSDSAYEVHRREVPEDTALSSHLQDWHAEATEEEEEEEHQLIHDPHRAHCQLQRIGQSSAPMHMERSMSGTSQTSSLASFEYSSPRRRSNAGDVRCQIPIRDTPNNPFLQSHHDHAHPQTNHHGRRRTGRGEDAARAQRNGYLACVFRGQRILQLDVSSDDSDDEDALQPGSSSQRGGRLQPKLLFPEAHAQEARRARQRQIDEQARLRRQRNALPLDSLYQRQELSGSSARVSSRTTSYPTMPAGRTLFADRIRQQAEDRAHQQRNKALEVKPRKPFSRSTSSRQIEQLPHHDMRPSTAAYHRSSRADPRLLATLDRAGWESDEDGENTYDSWHSNSPTQSSEEEPRFEPKGRQGRSSREIAHNDPYAPDDYRPPPMPEDYDREREARRMATDTDAFWTGDGQTRQGGPLQERRTESSCSQQQAKRLDQRESYARPALNSRMTIHAANKRGWDGSMRDAPREANSRISDCGMDGENPFDARPIARQSRTSMHNGLPICGLPSRSMSSNNISVSQGGRCNAALPTSSSSAALSSYSQGSSNPFDLQFLAEVGDESSERH